MMEIHYPPVKKLHLFLLLLFIAAFIWSAIKPYELGTWFLEVTPVILGAVIILYTYNRFRLTTLVYLLLFLGAILALIGGHYTYGKVPLFNWLSEIFKLGRNHYDRFTHLLNGVIWSLTLRELLIRTLNLHKIKILIPLVLGLVLGISSFYELVEWGVAILSGGNAEAFLGLQGDIWDTHWDMFLAFVGAVVCLFSFSSAHDHWLSSELHFRN